MLKSVQKLSVFTKYQIFNIDFMRLFEGQWLKIAPTAVIFNKISRSRTPRPPRIPGLQPKNYNFLIFVQKIAIYGLLGAIELNIIDL